MRQSGAFENPAAWPDIVYFWNTTWGIAIGDLVDGYFHIYTTNDLGTTWQKLSQVNISGIIPGTTITVSEINRKVVMYALAYSDNILLDLSGNQAGVYIIKLKQFGTVYHKNQIMK